MSGPDRPLIGVTTSEMRDAPRRRPQGDPAAREMALGINYLRAIERAGGLPLVMPPLAVEAIDSLLDQVGGICLSGGPDLDPQSYGERMRSDSLGPTEPDLDHFELAIATAASDRSVPILAICRGMQAFNVSRGGTLHQHLPDLGLGLGHRQEEPGSVPTHEVTLQPDSALASILGIERLETNSFHHQGIDRLGSGLEPVGRAADETIEAYEDPSKPFLFGVQWHAELHIDRGPECALFRRFVDAARTHAAGGARLKAAS